MKAGRPLRRRVGRHGRRTIESLEPRTFLSAGDLDPTFGSGGVVSPGPFDLPLAANAYATAFAPGGKLVVSGVATDGTGVVARFNPDGSLDTSFDGDGKVVLPGLGLNPDNQADVAVQPDAKVLFTAGAVVRLNADGSPDTTFGTNGVAHPDAGYATEVLLQPDGKILVASGGLFVTVARLDANGHADPTFSTTSVNTTFGRFDIVETVHDLALTPEGKILAAVTGDPRGATQHGVVVRINANGGADATFDEDGMVETGLPSGGTPTSETTALAVQSLEGGKVAVAGTTNGGFYFARFRVDGRTDPTYGTGGYVFTPNISPDFNVSLPSIAFSEMEYTPDGKVVAAGPNGGVPTTAVVVRRFLPDGSLDPAFGTSGEARMPVGTDPVAADLDVAPDGALAVAVHGRTSRQFSAARFTPQGQPDTTFNGGAVTTTFTVPGGDAAYNAIAEAAGGKLLAGGSLGNRVLLARHNPDGSLDTSFGTNGWTAPAVPGRVSGWITDLLVLPNGKIVAGGAAPGQLGTGTEFLLIRFNPDGTPDASFGNNGFVITALPSPSTARSVLSDIAVDSAGRVVAGGTLVPASGSTQFAAVRYTPAGLPDATFGGGDGIVTTNVGTSDDQAYAVAILPDDRIVLGGVAYDTGGTANSAWAFVKYLADGTLDPAFGNQPGDPGLDIIELAPDSNQVAQDLIARADDGFFATGNVGGDVALAAFNPNGSLDTSFGGGDGFVTAGFGNGTEAMPLRLARQADGKFVVVARVEDSAGTDIGLVRFTPAGAPDASFGGDGRVTTNLSPADFPTDMTLTSDGRIVVSGGASQPARPVLIRYLADGAAPAASVYVRGSTWASSFKLYMQAKGLGDDAYGYRVDTPGATPAAPILPWTNVDEIVVRYASAPTGGGIPAGNVVLDGIRSDYTASVSQVDPQTFVLRLDRPLGNLPGGGENGDRVQLTVPGAGPAGDALQLMLNVLQGDVNASGSVLADDYSSVKARFFKNTTSPTTGTNDYSPFHDVDCSGSILANDYSAVKARFFDNLPPATAAITAAPAAGAARSSLPRRPLLDRSATRRLLSSKAILG